MYLVSTVVSSIASYRSCLPLISAQWIPSSVKESALILHALQCYPISYWSDQQINRSAIAVDVCAVTESSQNLFEFTDVKIVKSSVVRSPPWRWSTKTIASDQVLWSYIPEHCLHPPHSLRMNFPSLVWTDHVLLRKSHRCTWWYKQSPIRDMIDVRLMYTVCISSQWRSTSSMSSLL